jgi:hypothetical protein
MEAALSLETSGKTHYATLYKNPETRVAKTWQVKELQGIVMLYSVSQ